MKQKNKQKGFFVNTDNALDDDINFIEVFEKYGRHWKWFLLGVLMSFIAAFTYLSQTPSRYEVSSTILIDDPENGNVNSDLALFNDLGIISGSKNSMVTESGILRSRTLMKNVIQNLKYNVSYYKIGWFKNTEILPESVPYQINFLTADSIFKNLDTVFKIRKKSNSTLELLDSNGDLISTNSFGEQITSNFGSINITPKNLRENKLHEDILVKITPLKKVSESYRKRLSIGVESAQSNLLVLRLNDPLRGKAIKVLDNLVEQYNKNAIEDKSQIARSTDIFINKRLSIISRDLSNVDIGVEQFKSRNSLTDIEMESNIMLNSISIIDQKIVELNTQIKLVDYIIDFINNNEDEFIPPNLSFTNETSSLNKLNSETSYYNELLAERNRLSINSNELHPTVINLNDQISKYRTSILNSLNNSRSSLKILLKEQIKQEERLSNRSALGPKREREIRDIKRQQQIVETLYLYLLKKREENSILLAATVANAKIIDKADGSIIPISPKKISTYLLWSFIGLLVPLIIVHVNMIRDNKVHTIDDLEEMFEVPILGDIPSTTSDKILIIDKNSRSNIAESFRLLRTNIDFMLSNSTEMSKLIFITSTLENEGKTFIAINLASSLALLNKKVLLISGDIRRPKVSKYLNISFENGLTNYLIDKTLEVADIIVNHQNVEFDILTAGPIPPNPSELLANGRFDEVVSYGRANYDYVIVDTAPVNIVTDTLLQGQQADLFIYVFRANYLNKRMLKIPKKMYENKRLPNMAMLINDTTDNKRGYSYGYGDEGVKLPFWKRVLGL